MSETHTHVSAGVPDAQQWLEQRRIGFARIEELKLAQLRRMSEADAARVFAQLDPPRPYELRPSSGLVEQQAWFSLLRAQLDADLDGAADERNS